MNRNHNGQQRIDKERMRAVLRERMGLDTETVGPNFAEAILDSVLKESGMSTATELLDAVAQQGELWQLLVKHAAVGETWFLRDQKPFMHFVEIVRQFWERTQPAPVRVLSYPCASGEEPYSMRIVLSDAGIPSEACVIDGADISQQALRQAREGMYSVRSFRGSGDDFQQQHFDPLGKGQWSLRPEFTGGVRFAEANLLEDDGLRLESCYDIIFCRNLLIYLCAEARVRLLSALQRRMHADSVLIVGHAEAGIVREAGYTADGAPSCFAFVRRKIGLQVATEVKTTHTGIAATAHPTYAAESACKVSQAAAARTASVRVDQPAPALEEIRRDADAGQLERASEACQRYVEQQPESSEGHYLLGIICSAQGCGPQAESAFRKALYLDPAHAEARLHLSLLRRHKPVVRAASGKGKDGNLGHERRMP